jgi:hypothetical protein
MFMLAPMQPRAAAAASVLTAKIVK